MMIQDLIFDLKDIPFYINIHKYYVVTKRKRMRNEPKGGRENTKRRRGGLTDSQKPAIQRGREGDRGGGHRERNTGISGRL